MRTPSDLPPATKPASHRGRTGIIVAVGVLVVVLVFLHTFAVFYTDALWFSSVQLHAVWVKLFEIKAGLMLVFSAISYSWGWIPNVWFMLDRDRAVRVLTRFRAAIAKHDIAIITAALMVVGLYLLIFGLVTE